MAFRIRSLDLPDEGALAIAVADAAFAHDGVDPFNEASRLAIRRGDAVVHGAIDDGGDIVAALVDATGDATSLDLATSPRHRRRGAASQLLARLNGERYAVWAHGELEPARRLADELGLARVRDLWQMRRDVTPHDPFDATLPDGFAAHPFDGSDEQAAQWLEVNASAFVNHPEQGRMTMDDMRERMAEEWFDPAGLILVRHEATGALAASHWTKREPGSDVGEVYVVAVAPRYQGRGIAGPLTDLGLQHLARQGVSRIELYVEGDNEPAKATYTRRGFTRSAHDVTYLHARPAGLRP